MRAFTTKQENQQKELRAFPKLSSVGAALPRLCPQSSECESSHRNRRIEGFLQSFKIVIVPTFLRFWDRL
ncbi:hypothetical protein B9T54_04290 [Leptospira borgpetersenii serovar Hardjo-bovis]|nr:hypothetical protein B9T54_04290 [Leptospira borgpetersenii serovar Hardjo-bovis]